jgi:asparagine synthase (glutamine-hydrolysing)
MCGISGIVFRTPESPEAAFRYALNLYKAQKHRGPDGGGILLVDSEFQAYPFHPEKVYPEEKFSQIPYLQWKNPQEIPENIKLVLCHQRLSVLELSELGHQPMCDAEKKYWITYNGELYSHLQLRREFLADTTFFSGSDTETLLHLWKKKKHDCPEMLDGMWAFVVLDAEEKKLTLCRDRLGVKPLYYYHDKNYFVFASEIKSFVCLPFIEKKFNEACLPFYLFSQLTDFPDRTFLQNIFPLPAGQWMELDIHCHEIVKKKSYFTISFPDEGKDVSVKEFRNCTVEAVFRHTLSDIPFGLTLSGGIDSSVILSVLCRKDFHPINAFSAISPGHPADESVLIKKLQEKFGIKIHFVIPDAESFFSRWEEWQYALDFPMFEGSTFAQFLVMEKASQTGIRVLLGGQGSDEWLAGYHHHKMIYYLRSGFAEKVNLIGEFFKSPLQFSGNLLHTFFKKEVLLYKLKRHFPFLHSDLADNKEYLESILPPESLNEALRQDLTRYRLPAFLRCEDRTSMWFGVESRPVFSDDKQWMMLCIQMKNSCKIKNGFSKYILRQSFSDDLPHDIIFNRRKNGFSVPFYVWLKQYEKRILDEIREVNSPYVDFKKIPETLHPDNASMIFRLLALEKWKKRFATK